MDSYRHCICLGLFLFLHNLCDSRPQTSGLVEVEISDGHIIGRQLESDQKVPYYAFQDIPYAKAPVGALRFQEPQPVERWDGILNTTANRKICIQLDQVTNDPRETEDCLVLNVYTPVRPNGVQPPDSLPTLVWIHGGAFRRWSGAFDSFGPDYFIDQNVVVVTLNYRLGPLGFLATGDNVIPGNLGLKDQHLALQWVKNNIGTFGGDPAKVTIMGQSAGAASVGYHLMSKKSKGLFRAAIMHSSSPLTCWALQKYPKYAAYQLGAKIFKEFDKNMSSAEFLKLLQGVPIEKIKANTGISMPAEMANCQLPTSIAWVPVTEDSNYENALVTGMNHENLKNGNINKVPLLIGINSQEVLLFIPNLVALIYLGIAFDINPSLMITANLNMKEENKPLAAAELKEVYTDSGFASDIPALINFASDALFATPVARHAYLQSKFTDVFFYQFSHKGPLGQLNSTYQGAEGVGHEEELRYLFRDSQNADISEFPEDDILTHNRMVYMWSQFVKNMNPTAEENELTEGVAWPTVTEDRFSYLDINSSLVILEDPKKYKQWSVIIEKYAEKLLDTY
ncbi:unnamed protein product [Phaedon cochleariae]|uniref:Carboxylic ester hydrolase n=1 Tax=Phaedon cochleariae TaxID=80249 RepID=A0A9P0GRF4_PHACE|nr:unnamed protein product [Phaedon cochleariae]